ncbi:hypothetical protein M5K25_021936 [Dendrobium thyrsiflorum]|uniref:Uncharacterized protein n=1 Tax=Dendrobium thyrsiflorum TaxID=117978 RepID=A0ABD0UB15_DENTH
MPNGRELPSLLASSYRGSRLKCRNFLFDRKERRTRKRRRLGREFGTLKEASEAWASDAGGSEPQFGRLQGLMATIAENGSRAANEGFVLILTTRKGSDRGEPRICGIHRRSDWIRRIRGISQDSLRDLWDFWRSSTDTRKKNSLSCKSSCGHSRHLGSLCYLRRIFFYLILETISIPAATSMESSNPVVENGGTGKVIQSHHPDSHAPSAMLCQGLEELAWLRCYLEVDACTLGNPFRLRTGSLRNFSVFGSHLSPHLSSDVGECDIFIIRMILFDFICFLFSLRTITSIGDGASLVLVLIFLLGMWLPIAIIFSIIIFDFNMPYHIYDLHIYVTRGADRCALRADVSTEWGLLAGLSKSVPYAEVAAVLATTTGKSTLPNWIVAPELPVLITAFANWILAPCPSWTVIGVFCSSIYTNESPRALFISLDAQIKGKCRTRFPSHHAWKKRAWAVIRCATNTENGGLPASS